MPMTAKESESYYTRRRIYHWKAQGCSQKDTLKALKDEDGIITSLKTIKRNWNKEKHELLRLTSTGSRKKITPRTERKLKKRTGKDAKSVRKLQKDFKANGKNIHHSTIFKSIYKKIKIASIIETSM